MVMKSAVLFCELALAILAALLIGAAIVQQCCALYNLLAGFSWKRASGGTAVPAAPRPAFDRAVGIVFFATLINLPATFIIFQLVHLTGQVRWYSTSGYLAVACVALPMGILVLAGITTTMLPTTFGKGLQISLLSHFLTAILVSIIVLILLTFSPGAGLPHAEPGGSRLINVSRPDLWGARE